MLIGDPRFRLRESSSGMPPPPQVTRKNDHYNHFYRILSSLPEKSKGKYPDRQADQNLAPFKNQIPFF
jgi:hypothetical protein